MGCVLHHKHERKSGRWPLALACRSPAPLESVQLEVHAPNMVAFGPTLCNSLCIESVVVSDFNDQTARGDETPESPGVSSSVEEDAKESI